MRDPRTLYLAYGSNLHKESMKAICPSAQTVGIARLKHWRWQINTEGFANIVEAPAAPYSASTQRWLGPLGGDLREDRDRVYGVVYRLEKGDEAALDKEMEVRGGGYTKEVQTADFWGRWQDGDGEWKAADLRHSRIQKIKLVVYADRKVTGDGKATPGPYLQKLNKGIKDAQAEGIPKGYFEEYMRPFLVLEEEEQALKSIIADALAKGVDVRRLIEKMEAETEAQAQAQATGGVSGENGQAQAR
jgi:hypothetical protein